MGQRGSRKMKTLTARKFISIKEADEFFYLNLEEDIIQELRALLDSNPCRVFSFGGLSGIGKSTLINTLLYIYQDKQITYSPFNVFKSGKSSFSLTQGAWILMEKYVIPGLQDPVVFIDLEGLDALSQDIQTLTCDDNTEIIQDRFNDAITKLYTLMIMISDVFIFNVSERIKNEEKKSINKVIQLAQFICRSSEDYTESNVENLFIFKRNSEDIDLEASKIIWGKINQGKRLNDWIFPIQEIPFDCRSGQVLGDLNKQGYLKSIVYAMNFIVESIKNAEPRFTFERINSYITYINDGEFDYEDLIKMERKFSCLKSAIINSEKEFIKQHRECLNEYNYSICKREIVKEISSEFMRKENTINAQLCKFEKVILSKKYYSNDPKLLDLNHPDFSFIDTSCKELIEQIMFTIRLYNQKALKVANLQNKLGRRGKLIWLANGDRCLVNYQNGKFKVTEHYGMSLNWKPVAPPESISCLVGDILLTAPMDPFMTSVLNEKQILHLQNKDETYDMLDPILFGDVVAYAMHGGGWVIRVGLRSMQSILKVAQRGAAWAGIVIGAAVMTYEAISAYRNQAISSSAKGEILGKAASKTVLIVGGGSAGGWGGAMAGIAVGSAFPGIGTLVGAIIGGIVGSAIGTSVGTGLSLVIDKMWKIISPEKLLKLLEETQAPEGYWVDAEQILEAMKISVDNFNTNIPDALWDSCDQTIWPTVFFINLLSIIASVDQRFKDKTEDIMNRAYNYLQGLSPQVMIKDYIEHCYIILSKLVALMK